MKLFFCKDGVLRLGNNHSDYLVPMTKVQDIFRLPNDFEFFSRFMTNEVIIEKDCTFANLLRCLEPWIHYWSVYTMTELGAYLAMCKQPRIQKEVPYVHEVEFSHYVGVLPTNTHIINDEAIHNSDLLRVLQSEHQQFMSLNVGVNFNIENTYTLRGYSKFSNDLNIDVSMIPFEEWMHSNIYIRRNTNVIFYENALRSVADFLDIKIGRRNKYNVVFSKDMFNFGARHLEADKQDGPPESYSYVEGTTIFKLEEFIREVFRFLPQYPLKEHNHYSKIHRECINLHLSKEYDDDMTDLEIEMALADMISNSLNRYEELAHTVSELKSTYKELMDKKESQNRVIPFKPSNIIDFNSAKEKTVDSAIQLEDNNIVELSKFAQIKHPRMPESITTKNEKGPQTIRIQYIADPNAEMFEDIVKYSLEDGVHLKTQSEVFPGVPEFKRIMGLIDPLGFKDFDVANLANKNFKTIEELSLDSPEGETNNPQDENKINSDEVDSPSKD